MGLKSAPSTFCRVVNAMLQGLPAGVAIDYVDDVLIATDGTFEEHMNDVGAVFDRLLESGFTVKAKKCFFGYREVPYLGYLVGVNGVRLDPSKIEGILALTFEAAIMDPGHFVGVLQHYSRHIANFAILAAPFFDLKRAKQPDRKRIVAKDEEGDQLLRAAYTLLLDSISNDDFLARPDFSRPFILATDASAIGAGAVLAQLDDDGHERPIAFWSHLFNKDERGGSVTDREGRALRDAVRHFRTYLTGTEFTAYTDHQSLTWLMAHQHADNSVRQRWQSQLQAFTGMTITHRPGKDMVVPDAISRVCALVAMNKDVDPRLRLSSRPRPVEDIDALLRPEGSAAVEDDSVFEALTLGDVPDFVNPRSFMLTADTPSSTDGLAAAKEYDSKVARAAAALGISAPRPLVWPEVATRQDAAPPPTPLDTSTGGSVEVKPAQPQVAKQHVKNVLNPRAQDARVGAVLLSGSRVLLWRLELSAILPGGAVEHVHKTYRDHMLLHYARLFGSHTPESLDAIRYAGSVECCRTKYFLGVLPAGYEVPACTKTDPWVDPVAGCLHDPPQGNSFWVDLDDVCQRACAANWPASVGTVLAEYGVAHPADVQMFKRLLDARLEQPRHQPSLAAFLRSSIPRPARPTGEPSSNSSYLSTHEGRSFELNGPSFHDCHRTAAAATAYLYEVASADTLHVLGVDLEGTLRPGGVVETIQIAAYLSDGTPVAHVFDIRADSSPLTGHGYDGDFSLAGAAGGNDLYAVRMLLEDPQFVKVFHCGRGDMSILASEYGILCRNVFDTSVGDCLLRSAKLGVARSLRKCVMEYAGVDLPLKESISHDPSLWRQRPMSMERYTYAYTDVLHLRAVFTRQSALLSDAHRLELAFDFSRSYAPPMVYALGHGLYCRPERVAFAVYNKDFVFMLNHDDSTTRALPGSDFTDELYDSVVTAPMPTGRSLWQSIMGKPVAGLGKVVTTGMRKPSRLGGCLLYEMPALDMDADFMVHKLMHSLNAARVLDAATPKPAGAADLRLPPCKMGSVPLIGTDEQGWNRLLFQYLLYIMAARRPPSAAGDNDSEGEKKGEEGEHQGAPKNHQGALSDDVSLADSSKVNNTLVNNIQASGQPIVPNTSNAEGAGTENRSKDMAFAADLTRVWCTWS